MDPKVHEVSIHDIAHALSNVCRFGGHCLTFYSVAQHSCHVCDCLPEQHKLWGLLHDAAEAYLADLTSPVKRNLRSMRVAIYDDTERRIMEVVAKKFSLRMPEPPEVREADLILLATEKRDIMTPRTDWALNIAPAEFHITPWTPTQAKLEFMRRFLMLTVQPKVRRADHQA